MRRFKLIAVFFAAVAMIAVNCAKSEEAAAAVDQCAKVNEGGGMCGDITSSKTYAANSTISIRGAVKIKSGATLTIGAGSTIKADTSTLTYLLIERGATITAIGNAASPIVFTSGGSTGSRNPSDWGGVVIHGKSATNNTAALNYATDSEIFTGPYGCGESGNACAGTLGNNDSSGTLQYIRIEFAGREISAGKEFNGLFLAGVGKGTTIDHVQFHRGSDDGIEIFGGAVDIRYALITDNQDDGFDVDEGWRGTAQYVAVAVPKDGDQGIEYDGIGADASRATNVPLSNFTIVGSINKTVSGAISVRASGTMSLYNSYIAHFSGTQGVVAVADNSVCLAKNTAATAGTSPVTCSGSAVTPDANFVGTYRLRFESNVMECMYTETTFTTAKTTLDSLFARGNQPNGASASSFNANSASAAGTDMSTVGRFPTSTGTGNNVVTNLGCTTPKLSRPGDGVLWGVTTGINELRPTAAITATYTDPQAAPNATDMGIATFIGAFQTQTDHWGDLNMNWVSFPAN